MHNKNIELINKHLNAENDHDLPGTLATLHEDCIFEDIALNRIYTGIEGASEYYRIWWDAFNLKVLGERRYWTEDGNVIAEPIYSGKHVNDFYGIPATGRKIEIRLAVFVTFKDGLMIGERFYYDSNTLFRQLGIQMTSSPR